MKRGVPPVAEHVRSRRRWTRRIVVLGLGVAVAAALSAAWTERTEDNVCDHAVVARAPSPDGAWEALTVEYDCPAFVGGDSIVAEVQLASTREPTRTTKLLGVDTGGHVDGRPRVAWVAPDVLKVTVYNHALVKVLAERFDGVRLDLRFDPDDPADWAAWLHWLQLPLGERTKQLPEYFIQRGPTKPKQ